LARLQASGPSVTLIGGVQLPEVLGPVKPAETGSGYNATAVVDVRGAARK